MIAFVPVIPEESSKTKIRQSRSNALFEMMDGVDFVDGMDTEKTHLLGDVPSVHNVHSVHWRNGSSPIPIIQGAARFERADPLSPIISLSPFLTRSFSLLSLEDAAL